MVKFTFATYNITHQFMLTSSRMHLWGTRKKFVLSLIEKINTDILCLQEDFPSQLRFLLDNTTYHAALVASADIFNKEHCAILYNPKKFTLLAVGRRFLSETPEKKSKIPEARTYQHCTYAKFSEKKTNREFFVFNAHFPVPIKDESRAVIARSLQQEIHKIAKKTPFLFCGDLNTWPSAWFSRALGPDLVDTFTLFTQKEFNTRHEWPGRKRKKNKERIDYIFVSRSLKKSVKSYKIHREKILHNGKRYAPSDHCPVVVHIEYP